MNRRKAFTLIEVIIAAIIFCLLLAGVYKLLIGGSKTAGKGQWINTSIEQMRNALTFMSNEIGHATYPTTMLKDTIYDPCDNSNKSVASKYYMRILKNDEPINVPSSGDIKIMDWFVCNPEKPETNTKGSLINYKLYLEYKTTSGSSVTGDLVLETETFDFSSDSKSGYAKSGNLNLSKIENKSYKKVLVNDVENVTFMVGGKNKFPPQKSVDFFPISVKIRTLYPKDLNVFKENSIMATPQVAIDLL